MTTYSINCHLAENNWNLGTRNPSFIQSIRIVNLISVTQNKAVPGVEFKVTDCSVYADESEKECKYTHLCM